MRKLFSKAFPRAFTLALAAAVSACVVAAPQPTAEPVATQPAASTQPAAATTTSAPGEVVVIKGIHQFSPGAGFQAQLQALTDDFNASHPNIRVEWDWSGFETYFQKVQIAVEGGQQLDLLYRAGVRDLGMQDVYLNLNEYMDSPSYDDPSLKWKDTFPASIVGPNGLYWLTGVPQGDGIYGVPNEFIVEGVWYNKALFEEHNIAIPTTYDEFIAACDTLRAAGVAPVLQDNDQGYNANIWIELAGFTAGEEAFLAAAAGEGSFDTPEFVQAAELAQNFAKHCFQDAWTGYQWPAAQTLLAQNGGAMNVNGSWLPSELGNVLPEGFRLGFFRMPPVPGGAGTANMMQSIINGFVVLKKSEHPAEAVEYLKFISSQAAAETIAAQGNLMARNGVSVPQQLSDIPAVIEDSTLVSRAFGTYEDYQDWLNNVAWKYADMLLVGTLQPAEFAQQLEQATKEYWTNK